MSASIYQLNQKIGLTSLQDGVPNFNMPMNGSEFRLYRGVQCEVEFTVRNVDRKPINLQGKTLTASLIDESNGETLLMRDLEIVNAQKGKAKLVISPVDTVDWQLGVHNYSILITNEDGSQSLLFMDENYKAVGHFQLGDAALPHVLESKEVTTFTPVSRHYNEGTYYVSSTLEGSSMAAYINTVHTLAVYAENFTGKFWVEAALTEEIPHEEDWFVVNLLPESAEWQVVDFTGLEAFTIDACIMWVRFVYQPAPNNQGKITKILYKN